MKKITFFFAFLINFSIFSQNSYTFGVTVPPNAAVISSVSPSLFGDYENEDSPIDFEISKDGIVAVSVITNRITRATLRESTKYSVRNNYIFGVIPNDSLPCFLEGDDYVFGILTRQTVISSGSENKLVKIDEQNYMINFLDNGTYTPCLLTFNGKNLSVRYFDYISNTDIFNKISNKKSSFEDAIQNVVLEPNIEEWKKLPSNKYLGKAIIYTRK